MTGLFALRELSHSPRPINENATAPIIGMLYISDLAVRYMKLAESSIAAVTAIYQTYGMLFTYLFTNPVIVKNTPTTSST